MGAFALISFSVRSSLLLTFETPVEIDRMTIVDGCPAFLDVLQNQRSDLDNSNESDLPTKHKQILTIYAREQLSASVKSPDANNRSFSVPSSEQQYETVLLC